MDETSEQSISHFSCKQIVVVAFGGKNFRGIIVLHVPELDIMHPITHMARRTMQSLVARIRGNLSNKASQPLSCWYYDVTLITSILLKDVVVVVVGVIS